MSRIGFLLTLIGAMTFLTDACQAQVPVMGARIGSPGYSGYGLGYYGGYGEAYGADGYGADAKRSSLYLNDRSLNDRLGPADRHTYDGLGTGVYGYRLPYERRSSMYDGFGYGKYEPNYGYGTSTYGYSQAGRPYYAP